MYVRASVFVDARLSPVEEAQCVSEEVEGESMASLYKSGQITEVEWPATPFHYPTSSALCQPTHTPLLYDLVNAILAPDRLVDTVLDLHYRVQDAFSTLKLLKPYVMLTYLHHIYL